MPAPTAPRRVLVEIEPVACVVDETAAEDSSSSDSDAEDTSSGRRRSKQQRASSSGGMPGWIGRLAQAEHGPGCSSLSSPGRLCRAHATIQGGAAPSPARAQAAAAALQEALAAAQLQPSDIVSLKAYCPAALVAGDAGGGGLSAEALRHCLMEALGPAGMAAAVVPVTAVGGDDGCPAGLQLELLALRLP